MSEINEINRFFLSKSLASTYKPTFLKCLLDLADYSQDEGSQWIKQTDGSFEVDLNFVAVRFIRYYWPLKFKFKLKQEATPTPIVMYRLLDDNIQLFEKNKSQPSKKELCSDKFSEFRLKVIREGIKPQVLHKLLNDCKIYTVAKGSNSIIIKKPIVDFIRNNKKILESALNHVIAEYLEKFNQAPNISTKLEEKIPRTNLKKDDFDAIIKLQNNKCFYCENQSDGFAQEHFIPWNYVFDTQAINIVAACESCNSSKSDRLPSETFFEKILARNQKLQKKSYGYSDEGFRNLYSSCKSEYHGSEQSLWSPKS